MVIDLSPAQSAAYRERGVARHTLDFARAVVRRHPDLIGHLLVDPRRPPVGDVEDLVAGGRAIPVDQWRGGAGGVLHLTSPFELDAPLSRLWPRVASSTAMRLVVTVYDLIPEVFPEAYLADPGLRRRWRARRELVQAADHVFTLSQSGTTDVVSRLGVPPSRVTVIGAGCAARFRRPSVGDPSVGERDVGRAAGAWSSAGVGPGTGVGTGPTGRSAARSWVPGPGDRFVVYNGAVDPRKNLDRLLRAWARVAGAVRHGRHLVVVCRMAPLERHHYEEIARSLGIGDEVILTGAVSDDVLVLYYQLTELMVFPSLYEGYGLPVVEAQACGAPVIVARSSSLVELVEPEACFDPYDVDAMAAAIERGLTDGDLRARLRARSAQPRPSWEAVADRAAGVYRWLAGGAAPGIAAGGGPEAAGAMAPGATVPGAVVPPPASDLRRQPPRAGRHPARWRSVPAIAVVPGTPRFAELDAALVAVLGDHAEVDRFGARGRPLTALPALAGARGGYAAVIITLGADPGAHAGLMALRWVTDRAVAPVVAVAHEVSLCAAYDAAGELVTALRTRYPREGLLFAAPPGALLVKEAVERCVRYLAPSEGEAALVRAQVAPELTGRVQVLAPAATDRWAIDILAAISG